MDLARIPVDPVGACRKDNAARRDAGPQNWSDEQVWSNIVDSLRAAGRTWPIVPVSMLEETIASLDRIATGG